MFSSTFSVTSALDGGGRFRPHPSCFTFGNDPVPSVQEAGWDPEPAGASAENFTLNAIRTTDSPDRSKSLY